MRIITFKLDDRLLQAIDRYAVEHRMSRSEVIRLAIIKLVNSNEYRGQKISIKKLTIS
ncbi:MAG: ribbon-helix-helix protein, CopG family [Sulfolobales archaeon]|jgi:metal-responsive CopG/Arc/MetJ family transcriptional regulator|nr:ribbon-helix-helix protein, CopG family [Desulfurococcaceae archaeon]